MRLVRTIRKIQRGNCGEELAFRDIRVDDLSDGLDNVKLDCYEAKVLNNSEDEDIQIYTECNELIHIAPPRSAFFLVVPGQDLCTSKIKFKVVTAAVTPSGAFSNGFSNGFA